LVQGLIFVPNSFKNSPLHSGYAGQAKAVAKLPSTQGIEEDFAYLLSSDFGVK
jgi:hypothetical protein